MHALRLKPRLLSTVVVFGISLLGVSCLGDVPTETLPETDATLTGTITYNGKPVNYALILVMDESGNGTAQGNLDSQADGTYTVPNCPLGKVKIGVNTDAGKGFFTEASMAASAPGPDGKAKKVNLSFVPVPPKFHKPETSGITTTVEKGENTFNIDIK